MFKCFFVVLVVITIIFGAPIIDSITPSTGKRASSVTIRGFGFGSTKGNLTFIKTFNLGSSQSWNDTLIIDTIPSTSQRGYYNLKIFINSGDSVFSPDSFRVLVPSAGWGN